MPPLSHHSACESKRISISTTEAEIMAASLAATEIVFMRGLLAETSLELVAAVADVDLHVLVLVYLDECNHCLHIRSRSSSCR